MISKKKYKIATILPYKESYTFDDASAVSLWVSEFYKRSIHKNNNFIYGNANSNKYLTKNYVNNNIPVPNVIINTKNLQIFIYIIGFVDFEFIIIPTYNCSITKNGGKKDNNLNTNKVLVKSLSSKLNKLIKINSLIGPIHAIDPHNNNVKKPTK